MFFIFGNYGDNTIAALQWAHNQRLLPLTVVHVDTGSGTSCWQQRVDKGQMLAKQYGFNVKTLYSGQNLLNLAQDRNSFPSAKYQWCPTFLKALPFLAYLDEIDPSCEGIIILGARQQDSRLRQHMAEFIPESEHYGDRKVWYPLYQFKQLQRDELILAAGFEIMNSRSLECMPCIHSSVADLKALSKEKIEKIHQLETSFNQTLFASRYPSLTIKQVINLEESTAEAHLQLDNADRGCGSFYACGE